MGIAENVGLMTRLPEEMFPQMTIAIGCRLSNLASSDDREDREAGDDEDIQQGMRSEDDGPGWVLGTISEIVHQHIKRFQQKQMKLDELNQPEWGDTADKFCERDKQYSKSELIVVTVDKLQTDYDAAAPAPTIFRELMVCLDIFPGLVQLLQGTARPGSTHLRSGSGKLQSDAGITALSLAAEHDSSHMRNAMPVEPISFYPCI